DVPLARVLIPALERSACVLRGRERVTTFEEVVGKSACRGGGDCGIGIAEGFAEGDGSAGVAGAGELLEEFGSACGLGGGVVGFDEARDLAAGLRGGAGLCADGCFGGRSRGKCEKRKDGHREWGDDHGGSSVVVISVCTGTRGGCCRA